MERLDEQTVQYLEDKAYSVRYNLLNFIHRIGMGHLGGELSMVEVAVALYFHYLKYDIKNPKWPDRDRFVLSKGHCSETLYNIYAELGAYTQDYMVEHFETMETAIFGMHSNRKYVPYIEASAGSLGHGLPIAVGMALGARYMQQNWRTYVMVGDGELNEGSNWEAIMAGSHHQLGNLICIVDKNRLEMTSFTVDGMNVDPLDKRFESFGWDVRSFDGNNMREVCDALAALPEPDYSAKRSPVCLISNTTKGCGVPFMEDNWKWHGGAIAKSQLDEACACLQVRRSEK